MAATDQGRIEPVEEKPQAEEAADADQTQPGTQPESPEQTARGARAAFRDQVARRARAGTGMTRIIAGVPALGFLIGAVVLSVATIVDVVRASIEYIRGGTGLMELATEFVEYADIFLLAVVLYILGLGLVTLFISNRIPLPAWLNFNDLDDLKERLVSVIGVMLGVYFLGRILQGASGMEALWLGLGCSVIILALAFFVRSVFNIHHGPHGGGDPDPAAEPKPTGDTDRH